MNSSYYRLLLLLILFGTIIGCGSRLDATPEATQADDDTVQLTVHLARDRDIYSVGEFIALGLRIVNERETPIEIHNFSFSGLAFSHPNSMHLIGPDSEDRLLPYRLSNREMESFPPIQVETGEEEWMYVPLSNYLLLRMPGRYSFWLELVDDEGNRYRSNEVDFELVTIEPSVPTDPIELSLQPESSSFSATEPIRVKATFTNNSGQPVTFLKPQDGSLAGWINPVYTFTVTDEASRNLPQPPRSALLTGPVYNKQTRFTLLPGESYEQEFIPPPLAIQNPPGKYSVRLTYIVHENALRMGVVTDQKMNWEEEVFIGLIESNDIIVMIEP